MFHCRDRDADQETRLKKVINSTKYLHKTKVYYKYYYILQIR